MLFVLDFDYSSIIHTRKYNLFTSYIRDSINFRQTMELNKQGTESLNVLREKIIANNSKWTFDEKIHLQTIYQAITKKVLSLNCSGCWITACNIINNYIKYHETTPTKELLKTEVIRVKPSEPVDAMTIKMMKSLLKEKNIPIPHNATRAILIDLING
jgi:acyl-homoserine lactone acylase PvdQ